VPLLIKDTKAYCSLSKVVLRELSQEVPMKEKINKTQDTTALVIVIKSM
jgi:hypothetical protein